MGKIVRKRKEFSGSSNSAENIMYDATKNVKEVIDETKNEVSELNSNLGINTVNGVSYCKIGNARLLQINTNLNNISAALSALGVELDSVISISGTHNNNNAYKIATLIINQDLTVTCYSRAYGSAVNTEETSGYFNGLCLIPLQ